MTDINIYDANGNQINPISFAALENAVAYFMIFFDSAIDNIYKYSIVISSDDSEESRTLSVNDIFDYAEIFRISRKNRESLTNATKETSVNGIRFEVWSDFVKRATFARNAETGEEKRISGSGYVSKDLTVRKAIAAAFKLPTFKR